MRPKMILWNEASTPKKIRVGSTIAAEMSKNLTPCRSEPKLTVRVSTKNQPIRIASMASRLTRSIPAAALDNLPNAVGEGTTSRLLGVSMLMHSLASYCAIGSINLHMLSFAENKRMIQFAPSKKDIQNGSQTPPCRHRDGAN